MSNSLASMHPELVPEWSERNLPLSPDKITYGSNKLVWYDLSRSGEHPLLAGGGVGIPPLYGLAKRLTAQGKRVTAVLGFNRKSEIFLAEEFRALGAEVVIATADGSVGLKGLVTDGMAAVSDYTYLYTCGPEPMLKAVYADCKTSGQFSFEERMGCGF